MNSSGIWVGSLLTIVFLVLKLTHVIAWSWWWVFSPLLIGAGLVAVVAIVLAITVRKL